MNDEPEKRLKTIKQPVLFLRGEHDPIAPTKWLKYLEKKGNNVRQEEKKGVAHAINFNSPSPLTNTIIEFLSQST